MTNIVLFVLTTIFYRLVWFLCNWSDKYYDDDWNPFKRRGFKRLAITALLCLPLNINGNVFTVLGNVHSTDGVKNITSVFSMYQNAENNAFALASIVQKSGNDSFSFFGSLYQNAGREAMVLAGLSIFQKSIDSGAIILMGGVVQQEAKERAAIGVGIAGRQISNKPHLYFGFAAYQYGSSAAETRFAMALFQQAGQKNRSFAVWSRLEAESKQKSK